MPRNSGHSGRRRIGLLATAAVLAASIPTIAGAGHEPAAVASYTGCLMGSNLGRIAVGNAPSTPCGAGQRIVHFSGGDITAVTAGAGLSGGGPNGAVALSVLFGGAGAATSAARSDHDHAGTYATPADVAGLQAELVALRAQVEGITPGLDTVRVRQTAIPANQGAAGVNVMCAPGEVATGGGYELSTGAPFVEVYVDRPILEQGIPVGWTIGFQEGREPIAGNVSVLCASAAAASPQLAPDSAFDFDPGPFYYTNGSATFIWASDAANSPPRALKIVSTQPAGVLTRWMSRIPMIPATAGARYEASAFLKTEDVTGSARLCINFWDATETYIPPSTSCSSVTLTGTQPFTQVAVAGTAPPGSAFLRVEFRLFGPGSLWADDVSVVRTG